MITQGLRKLTQLQLRPCASYIYLQNHEKRINTKGDALSFHNPKYALKQEPVRYQVPLNRKVQKKVDEKKFKEYRDKMIASNKVQNFIREVHPVWEGEEPTHYFSQPSLREYFHVPSIRRAPEYTFVPEVLRPNQAMTDKVDFSNLQQYTVHHLVQIALKMRLERSGDGELWYKLDKLLEKKLHNLSVDEVVQLKFAFAGHKRFGSVEHHKILNDLIDGDAEQMSISQLIAAVCALGSESNSRHQENIVGKIVDNPVMLGQVNNNPQLLIQFVRAFATYRPLQVRKNILKRTYNQQRNYRQQVLNKLNITKYVNTWPLEDVVYLVRALYQLEVEGVRDIMVLASRRLLAEHQNLDPFQAFELLFAMQKIDEGEALSIPFYEAVKQKFLDNWDKFTDLHRIKIIFCYWNVSRWDEFAELYKQIPVTEDASMLYYFAQIEMIDSSGREGEVVRGIGKLDYIPIPYYYRYKQFCNHLNSVFPNVDLSPLDLKFFQSAEFFTPFHLFETIVTEPYFHELGKFLGTLPIRVEPLTILENSELCTYAMTDSQICIDVMFERYFVPGTNTPKKTALLKGKSLQGMGWAHIGIRWSSFREKPRAEQVKWAEDTFKKAITEQNKSRTQRIQQEKQSIAYGHLLRFMQDMLPEEIEEMASDARLRKYIASGVRPKEWERNKVARQMLKDMRDQGMAWEERYKKIDEWTKEEEKKDKEEQDKENQRIKLGLQ